MNHTIAGLIFSLLITATAQTPLNALSSELEELLPNGEAGAVIGLISGGEQTVIVLGNQNFNEDTLFEYGSITKVFTALLLQQLANEGVLTLEDSLSQHFATEAEQWRQVNLRHLITHTAGIPDLPPNLKPYLVWLTGRNNDPFARYDELSLYKAVENTRVRDVGEAWQYSNFGIAVLGKVLETAMGQSYEDLLQTRILRPLAMQTASTTAFNSKNVAPPLKINGTRSNPMIFNAMAPAGALKGSMSDALKFLAAAMQACMQEDALSAALCETARASSITVSDTETQSLGWLRSRRSRHEVVWHNGGTRGYQSFLGFVPGGDVGLVVLMNVADTDITETSIRFLNSF